MADPMVTSKIRFDNPLVPYSRGQMSNSTNIEISIFDLKIHYYPKSTTANPLVTLKIHFDRPMRPIRGISVEFDKYWNFDFRPENPPLPQIHHGESNGDL